MEYDSSTYYVSEEPTGPSISMCTNTIIRFGKESDYNSFIAYRKYIPGHWEDADGNWINGSWSSWGFDWSDKEGQWMMGSDYVNDGYPSQNDKNAVIGMVDSYIETRTWNNTKPAPTT